MEASLNLGNGNWAIKEDSLLSYGDENGNFRPLPLDFTRASSATVTNKLGLIETVDSGISRIDFQGTADGTLLLEPQRTNLIQYSEDFSDASWTKTGLNVASGYTSPNGDMTAFKLIEDTSFGKHRINLATQVLTANTYSGSFFAKKSERDVVQIFTNGLFDVNAYANFDLANGVVSVSVSTTAKIELLSDGWYRCSYIFMGTTADAPPMYIHIVTSTTSAKSEDYKGDGTSGVYIYGAQLEAGSYATSYIPTDGGTVTRVAEVCNGAGNASTFNSTEGVLFLEMAALSDDDIIKRSISISNGSTSDRILIRYSGTSLLAYCIEEGNTRAFITTTSYTLTETLKLAFKYKLNDFALWVNGNEVGNDTAGATPIGLNALNFNDGDGTKPFYGKTKQVQVFKTALTDNQLILLTGESGTNFFESYTEMASVLTYTIQ